MKITIFMLMAVVMAAVGLEVGCTPKASNSSNTAASVNPNYSSPNINGVLSNIATNKSVLNISNITGANSLAGGVVAPATLLLDLSASVDPNGTSMTPTVVVTGGTSSAVAGNSMQFNLNFPNPVAGKVSVTLLDKAGQSSTLSFIVPVECNLSIPPIVIPAGAITVSAGSGGAGYINLAINGVTGGSGQGFSYVIDFNGDGRYDFYSPPGGGAPLYINPSNIWTNVYDLYNFTGASGVGAQNVSVMVIDNKCLVSKVYSQAVNYQAVLPAIQSGALASTSTSYYYLQGQVDTLTGSADPADTVHVYDAMDPGMKVDNTGTHVRCNYNYSPGASGAMGQGSLSVSGFNVYSDGNPNASVEQSLSQKMEISINGIPDDGSLAPAPATNIPASESYQTSAAPDGNFSGTLYGGNCTASPIITRAVAEGACAAGTTGMQSGVITMSGTYSCPSLSSSKKVSVTHGYFYCQYDTAQSCIGSGESGGNPPPPH